MITESLVIGTGTVVCLFLQRLSRRLSSMEERAWDVSRENTQLKRCLLLMEEAVLMENVSEEEVIGKVSLALGGIDSMRASTKFLIAIREECEHDFAIGRRCLKCGIVKHDEDSDDPVQRDMDFWWNCRKG
jgi:hypothetical protein